MGPFKGLLLGLFFFTVGMNIDARELVRDPVWLIASVVGLIAIKAAVLATLARGFGLTWPVALETGLLLGPGGEFAFIVIGMASVSGIVSGEVASFVIAVTSITMALIPLLSHLARRINARLRDRPAAAPALPPVEGEDHAIVVGYGRVGQVVCAMLERHGLPYVAVDNDPKVLGGPRSAGRERCYGNATDPDLLQGCGLARAKAVIITISGSAAVDEIVGWVRHLRGDVTIIARARDADHARHLYAAGVSVAVPETIEASLQLSEAALLGLGEPTGRVIASVHEARDAFRQELRAEARKAAG